MLKVVTIVHPKEIDKNVTFRPRSIFLLFYIEKNSTSIALFYKSKLLFGIMTNLIVHDFTV